MKLQISQYGMTCLVVIAILAPIVVAQPPTADESISKDRGLRQISIRSGKSVAVKPKWGFFGTIFNVILEQINDTKSAYNQISELVGNQIVDEKDLKQMQLADTMSNDATTESTKLTRQEFLKILDRNLKGLARLRNIEWREARKDSWSNLQGYWNELFGKKKTRNAR